VVGQVDDATGLLGPVADGRPDRAVVEIRIPPGSTGATRSSSPRWCMSSSRRSAGMARLSAREREVFALMARGPAILTFLEPR
jgi:hypothetical protein